MIRKQTALVMPRIASVFLLMAGLAPVRAEADVVTAAGGESLQGTVTFREGDALEMASESGEKVRIALADLASLDLAFDGPPWLIGGSGVLTANGSFLSRPVIKMDGKVVIFGEQEDSLLLTRQNTAALFFQPLRSRDAEALRFNREGIVLRGGDFMSGVVVGLEEGRVTVDSLLLGRKSFAVQTEAIAVILRAPVAVEKEGWSLFLSDGSRLRSREIALTESGVLLNESPYRNHQIMKVELRGIRREGGQSILDMFRERWLALEPERPLAAAALGEDVSEEELAEALIAIGEERAKQETTRNTAKAEWIRSQQIVSRQKAMAARGAANVGRMQRQVQDKVRRVEQDQKMAQQAAEDLEGKVEMVEMAKMRVEEMKQELASLPREDADRRRGWEQKVRDAERQKQTAERAVHQARAIQRRHETRIKSGQRLVDMAEARVIKAREQKEKEDLAHRNAEEGLGPAKESYDRTSADLREIVEEYRRMEFLVQQRKNREEK